MSNHYAGTALADIAEGIRIALDENNAEEAQA